MILKIDFEEKYNREESENKWKEYWKKQKIFEFSLDSAKPLFVVDTPPPYVSADHLHIGHIMSYSQAEFIVRYKRMKGFNVFYPMGFDDNGLPTERFVEKKYKINKSKITKPEFIKICLKETEQGIKTYKKLWNDFGISVDWSKTYSTINSLPVKIAQWSFIDLYKKGKIYRAKKPISWCVSCQTALSQADIEDEEKETDFVYIKIQTKDKEKLVFATTRPELLPSCVGISVHPDDERYKKFIHKIVVMPITGAEIEITADKMVAPDFGSGVVYFCSSGDKQFLEWENNHKIKNKIYLLDTNGRMNAKAGIYQGLTIKQTRKKIIEDLKEINAIEKIEKIVHSVGVHERCGTDIEYVDSVQWFVDILSAKQDLLKQADKINWRPDSMKQKYIDWVKALKWDWCISRQRYYGVSFPVWYCKKCGEVILPNIEDLPVDTALSKPKIKQCPKCESSEFVAEKDVMDTWMTSSCSPIIVSKLVKDEEIQKKLYPCDLRPQAFEIIRTWLFYTIVKSFYHFNDIPFKNVMISGHGLDENGKKISKRLGNYIPANQLLKDYGADAIRYWATGATLGQNLRFNIQEVKKGKRTVVKLWNAGRFLAINLDEFDFDDEKKYKFEHSDIWIISELNKTIEKATKDFDNYFYAKAKEEIDNFFWSKFADYYVEFVKYRLAGDNKESKSAAQYTLTKVFLVVLKIYAPILPFITEELYQKMFKNIENEKSVHISKWPSKIKASVGDIDISDFNSAIKAIDEIRKYKSEQGISLGTEIESCPIKTKIDLDKYSDFIQKVCRVKTLKII